MASTKAAYQPLPQSAMDFTAQKEPCEAACQSHGACHARRSRRLVHLAAAALLALGALALVLFALCGSSSDMLGLAGDGAGLLGARATDSTTSGGDNSGVFVKNKLYLIVIIVGFFVVLVLGVMLAGWCCRGAFENPLCCPCYLCACCGGLACLECISCGLCAEGVDQIGFN